MLIREATEYYIARILEIENEAISPPWTHGSLLNEIYNDDSFFAVALSSDPKRNMQNTDCKEAVQPGCGKPADAWADYVIGFVILRRAADEGELLQVAVDKESQRRGVASKLIESAFSWARSVGIDSIYLEVRESNEAASGLYRKHGFYPVGERKNYYAMPTEDAVVMRKESP